MTQRPRSFRHFLPAQRTAFCKFPENSCSLPSKRREQLKLHRCRACKSRNNFVLIQAAASYCRMFHHVIAIVTCHRRSAQRCCLGTRDGRDGIGGSPLGLFRLVCIRPLYSLAGKRTKKLISGSGSSRIRNCAEGNHLYVIGFSEAETQAGVVIIPCPGGSHIVRRLT